MSLNERIMVDHDICNGKPVVSGTRITVQTILEFLAAGETVETITARYRQLMPEDINACIKFAADMAGHEYSIHKIIAV